jgi:hypothetical protein
VKIFSKNSFMGAPVGAGEVKTVMPPARRIVQLPKASESATL